MKMTAEEMLAYINANPMRDELGRDDRERLWKELRELVERRIAREKEHGTRR